MATVHFSLSALFALAFYDRFWKWRHEIAEVKTSYIIPDGANVTSGGMLWAGFAVIFALFGLIRIVRVFICRNRQI